MTAWMLRRRRWERIPRLEYALSARTRPGRVRGLPGPRRAMRTRRITGSNPRASLRWPALVTLASGRARLSAARGILVLRPPRERPSAAGSRLVPAQRPDFLSFDPAPRALDRWAAGRLVQRGRGEALG